jgi:Uma2 family endonuclease
MNEVTKTRLTVEQFLDWGDRRASRLSSDEPKWELIDGVPVMQEHERWIHADTKFRIMKAIDSAVRSAGLPYLAGIDGLGVRVEDNESFRPEVVVFPASEVSPDDRFAPNPVIVVGVLSPSSIKKDLTIKVVGYGRVRSILHYLVVDADAGEVLHYRRLGDVLVPPAAVLRGGDWLELVPPGITLEVLSFFRA